MEDTEAVKGAKAAVEKARVQEQLHKVTTKLRQNIIAKRDANAKYRIGDLSNELVQDEKTVIREIVKSFQPPEQSAGTVTHLDERIEVVKLSVYRTERPPADMTMTLTVSPYHAQPQAPLIVLDYIQLKGAAVEYKGTLQFTRKVVNAIQQGVVRSKDGSVQHAALWQVHRDLVYGLQSHFHWMPLNPTLQVNRPKNKTLKPRLYGDDTSYYPVTIDPMLYPADISTHSSLHLVWSSPLAWAVHRIRCLFMDPTTCREFAVSPNFDIFGVEGRAWIKFFAQLNRALNAGPDAGDDWKTIETSADIGINASYNHVRRVEIRLRYKCISTPDEAVEQHLRALDADSDEAAGTSIRVDEFTVTYYHHTNNKREDENADYNDTLSEEEEDEHLKKQFRRILIWFLVDYCRVMYRALYLTVNFIDGLGMMPNDLVLTEVEGDDDGNLLYANDIRWDNIPLRHFLPLPQFHYEEDARFVPVPRPRQYQRDAGDERPTELDLPTYENPFEPDAQPTRGTKRAFACAYCTRTDPGFTTGALPFCNSACHKDYYQ